MHLSSIPEALLDILSSKKSDCQIVGLENGRSDILLKGNQNLPKHWHLDMTHEHIVWHGGPWRLRSPFAWWAKTSARESESTGFRLSEGDCGCSASLSWAAAVLLCLLHLLVIYSFYWASGDNSRTNPIWKPLLGFYQLMCIKKAECICKNRSVIIQFPLTEGCFQY